MIEEGVCLIALWLPCSCGEVEAAQTRGPFLPTGHVFTRPKAYALALSWASLCSFFRSLLVVTTLIISARH